MAEIAALMIKIKAYLEAFLFVGLGVSIFDGAVVIDQYAPAAAKMIFYVLMVLFAVIRMVWYVYDKFFLESRERNQKMRIEKGEHSPNPTPYTSKITKKNKKAL